MTSDHPAWSPRAARGVVRDPLRFLAALGMTSMRHLQSELVSPLASHLSPLASHLSTNARYISRYAVVGSLAPLIPMTSDHPAWSPRAARGVVRDPLRFLAALGMTSMRHLQSELVSPLASHLSPLASHLSTNARYISRYAVDPLASRLAPLASRLSPLTSRLSPLHKCEINLALRH
jgi:hypothetical protein